MTPETVGLPDYEDVAIETADGLTLSAWYVPAAPARHVLLYLHGNAGNRRDWVEALPPFVRAGVSVLLLDYRGYGKSEGTPSEAGLYQDGAAAWRWTRRRAEAEGLPASLLGKSLGSGVAMETAVSQPPPHRLILDSAFTSMREVVARHAPGLVASLIPPLYESLERAPRLRCPTLLIHGAADTLIPPRHSKRLYERITAPRQLELIEDAGHNTLTGFPRYHEVILTFLDQESDS
jgi:hypothetical protein